MALKYPAITDPSTDPENLRLAVLALKQAFEIHSQQRGSKLNGAVTYQDLVDLGLITIAEVPD